MNTISDACDNDVFSFLVNQFLQTLIRQKFLDFILNAVKLCKINPAVIGHKLELIAMRFLERLADCVITAQLCRCSIVSE